MAKIVNIKKEQEKRDNTVLVSQIFENISAAPINNWHRDLQNKWENKYNLKNNDNLYRKACDILAQNELVSEVSLEAIDIIYPIAVSREICGEISTSFYDLTKEIVNNYTPDKSYNITIKFFEMNKDDFIRELYDAINNDRLYANISFYTFMLSDAIFQKMEQG